MKENRIKKQKRMEAKKDLSKSNVMAVHINKKGSKKAWETKLVPVHKTLPKMISNSLGKKEIIEPKYAQVS